MFNKKSVGKLVISKEYGTGTVIRFTSVAYFPVIVDWDNGIMNTASYTVKGWAS